MSTAAWLESVHCAWKTLRSNRLRTALTALSVALGACTMSLLVSLATSALATIMTGVDAVGGREMVFVEPKNATKPGAQPPMPLVPEDAEALRNRVPGVIEVAYMMSLRNQPLLANGHKLDVDIAIGASYPHLILQELAAGSLSTDDDAARHIVLVEPIAKELFGSVSGAVGKSVVLWQEHYVVTGVTREKPALGFNMGGVSRARAVFITTAAAMKAEGMSPRGFMVLRDDGRGDHDLEMAIAASILRQRHRGAADIEFFDMRAFLRTFDIVFAGIRVLVGLIAAVSLVVAGAGIMNVMLASIRQRISEIGIRRAVGASQADIRQQFLVEAVIIAAVGGVSGSVIGLAIATVAGAVIRSVTPAFRSDPSFVAAIAAVLCAGAVGLVFGLRPARRAAQMWIVDCLRGAS